jgi:hypothetical protein
MVADKDGSGRLDLESLQRTVKDLRIGLMDALGRGNQDGIEGRRQGQALQLPALHTDGTVRDQPKLHA